jgi:hypothetical protein
MLQQWARRFLTITQPPRYSPQRRASIRAFFANGVERFHLPWSVEALPALLHLSLFLFFTGLVIYLFNINHTVFSVVVWWVGLAGGVYGCVTLMPIFWHNSPYYSPLSSSVCLFFNFTYSAIRQILHLVVSCDSEWLHLEGDLLFEGLTKIVQESGSDLSAEIINLILTWTIQALEEDKELEQFFEAIPGFCSSESHILFAPDFDRVFTKFDEPLAGKFYGFIYRTLSSSLILEEDKKRRVIICAKATDAAHLSQATMYTIDSVFNCGADLLQTVDIWPTLSSTSGRQVPGLCSQGIIAGVIASVWERDERWEALAKDRLGVSEAVFQNYLANGDSILLANFIHISRPLFRLCLEDEYKAYLQSAILSCISKFDIENTLLGLQHDFCALWNEITQEARSRGSSPIPYQFLRPIRHLYIALHQGTDAAPSAFDASTSNYSGVLDYPFSYPLCNIPGHHTTGETSHPLTTTSDLPDAFLNPSTEPAVSSFPASTERHSRVHFAGESSLHGTFDATPTIESSRRSPPVNVETVNLITQVPTDTLPTISPTSNSESDPHPVMAMSIFTPSFAPPSTGSNNTPDPHNSADLGVIRVPDIQSSSSSGPVASETLPANTHSSSASPASRIDQVAVSSPELIPSTSAAAISPTLPQGTSVLKPSTEPNDGTSESVPDTAVDLSPHAASFS